MTAASIASVFASRPIAPANLRTWRGLTFATGRPAFNQRGGNHAFIAAANREHNQARRQRLQSLDQRAQTFRARRAAKPIAT